MVKNKKGGSSHKKMARKNVAPNGGYRSRKLRVPTEEGEIMGIRHRELPIWGVQFHPESILTEHGKELLGNFLKLN